MLSGFIQTVYTLTSHHAVCVNMQSSPVDLDFKEDK